MHARKSEGEPKEKPVSRGSSVEVGCVLLNERLLGFWKIVQYADGICRADRHAGAAIYALVRIHVQLRDGLKARFFFRGVDAVHRAGFDAMLILRASVDDDVGHSMGYLSELA